MLPWKFLIVIMFYATIWWNRYVFFIFIFGEIVNFYFVIFFSLILQLSREISTMKMINHPNVVKIYEVRCCTLSKNRGKCSVFYPFYREFFGVFNFLKILSSKKKLNNII
jgi:serine/threonine protein kinase